jgi:hypothetical protein
MHPTSADLILYGTLATLLVVVVLMSLWGIRSRAALEDEGLTLTAAGVQQRVGSQLLGPGFVWGVWQKLLSSTELRLVLRDETDALVTEVAFFHVPLDGVRHRFTWMAARSSASARACVPAAAFSWTLLPALSCCRAITARFV